MNFNNIFNHLEEADPEVYDRLSPRRNVLKNFGRVTLLTALPFALGAYFKKAYGKNTGTVADVLNFALTLEYLEAGFYNTAKVTNAGLIPASDQAVFNTILKHENEHVAFLIATISTLGTAPVLKPTFDFTAGGTFSAVFSDYPTFLAVSQTLEDTGVRAYKGQVTNLKSQPDILTAAMQIHSVEARHASHVRQMRAAAGATLSDGTPLKPWITGNQSGIASTAVQASYDGEDLTTQAGVKMVGLDGQDISANAASEAFDEPLDMNTVLAIVNPFIA